MSKKTISEPQNVEVLYAMSNADISYLEGRLLTVVEMATSDPEQRKAFKDVVRQNIWEWAQNSPMRVEKEHAKYIASFPENTLQSIV